MLTRYLFRFSLFLAITNLSPYLIHFYIISSIHLIHFLFILSHMFSPRLIHLFFVSLISSHSLIHCRISRVLSFCSSVCVWLSHFYWRSMIQVWLESMEAYGIQLWYGLGFLQNGLVVQFFLYEFHFATSASWISRPST